MARLRIACGRNPWTTVTCHYGREVWQTSMHRCRQYYSNAADLRGLLSTFVIALLNTAPSEQTVDVEFTDAFFDQVRHTCLAHLLCADRMIG